MLALPLLGLLLLVPLAAAQGLAVEVDELPYPIKPLVETGLAEVRVTAPCGVPVTLAAETPHEDVRASVEPGRLEPPACEGTWRGEATLRVMFAEGAPAMEAWPVIVRARAGNEDASASVAVTAAFVGLLDVQANGTEATVAPQRAAAFELAITNRGNANTKVSFSIVQRPPMLRLSEPVSIVLQPGQTATVPVMAHASPQNGYNDRTEVFTLHLASAHALHPAQTGDAHTVTFTVKTQGAYVPAAPAWLALAAGAGLLARREGTRARPRRDAGRQDGA